MKTPKQKVALIFVLTLLALILVLTQLLCAMEMYLAENKGKEKKVGNTRQSCLNFGAFRSYDDHHKTTT